MPIRIESTEGGRLADPSFFQQSIFQSPLFAMTTLFLALAMVDGARILFLDRLHAGAAAGVITMMVVSPIAWFRAVRIQRQIRKLATGPPSSETAAILRASAAAILNLALGMGVVTMLALETIREAIR
jgi:hypothetical protein